MVASGWTSEDVTASSAAVAAGETQGGRFEPRKNTNGHEFMQRGQWLRVKRRGAF